MTICWCREYKNLSWCVHSTLRLASGIGYIQIYQKSVRILKTSLGAMHIPFLPSFKYIFFLPDFMNIEKPVMQKKDGEITIDLVVNVATSMLMRTSTRLATEGSRLLEEAKLPDGRKRKAYFVDPKEGYCLDCTSCISTMMLAASPGISLKLKVEGEDEAAEKLALRLYSAWTSEKSAPESKDECYLDFYRYG